MALDSWFINKIRRYVNDDVPGVSGYIYSDSQITAMALDGVDYANIFMDTGYIADQTNQNIIPAPSGVLGEIVANATALKFYKKEQQSSLGKGFKIKSGDEMIDLSASNKGVQDKIDAFQKELKDSIATYSMGQSSGATVNELGSLEEYSGY